MCVYVCMCVLCVCLYVHFTHPHLPTLLHTYIHTHIYIPTHIYTYSQYTYRYRFDVDGDNEMDLSEFKQFMLNEITVLNNADTLKADISPILSQSRRVIHDEMHKKDEDANAATKKAHALHSGHHVKGKPLPPSCPVGCAQFKLHKACAHMGYPATTPAAGSSGENDPEFITGALKAQAQLESKIPGDVMKKCNQ